MERYKVVRVIGDGTYGSVSKAVHRDTGVVVAIKQMKKRMRSWNECVNLREVKVLLEIQHPNIVRLLEVIKSDNQLSLVFEFLDEDVYHHIKERNKLLPEGTIRNIVFQTLQGLMHMHNLGIFHRDLKPENLLIRAGIVKIADFGLAREVAGRPPFTEYVSTRWYRAPEVLLRAPLYGSAIDIFALGALMAELYTFKPLFPGSSEIDQLQKVCKVLGTPQNWLEGQRYASLIGFRFPMESGIPLQSIVQNASPDAIDLMRRMLSYAPDTRPTAVQALQHPYFSTAVPITRNPDPVQPQPPVSSRPAQLSNFPRSHQGKTEPKLSVLERMKKARYHPGVLCPEL